MATTKDTTEKKSRRKVTKLPHTNLTDKDKELATEILHDEAQMALSDFEKLSKEIQCSMVKCTIADIRFCVQSYYQVQKLRVALSGELRSIDQGVSRGTDVDDAPQAQVLQWLYNNLLGLETEIKRALDIWSDSNEVAAWCKKVCGIGPVISAGLVAYFDVTKAPSSAHFWSYGGLNDNNDPWIGKEAAKKLVNKYVKGPGITNDELIALSEDPECTRSVAKLHRYAYDKKKDKYTKESLIKGLSQIPYNPELKTLLWKLSDSFVKRSNDPRSLYGRLYKERKLYETKNNENKEYAEQAAKKLSKCNISKSNKAYTQYAEGILPEGHIHARCMRYAVKIFVAHLFEEMYRVQYNDIPPRPYVTVYGDHTDIYTPEVPYTEIDPSKRRSAPINPVKIY